MRTICQQSQANAVILLVEVKDMNRSINDKADQLNVT